VDLNRCGAITKLHNAISRRAVTLVLTAGMTSNLMFIQPHLDPSGTKIFNRAFNIRTENGVRTLRLLKSEFWEWLLLCWTEIACKYFGPQGYWHTSSEKAHHRMTDPSPIMEHI